MRNWIDLFETRQSTPEYLRGMFYHGCARLNLAFKDDRIAYLDCDHFRKQRHA